MEQLQMFRIMLSKVKTTKALTFKSSSLDFFVKSATWLFFQFPETSNLRRNLDFEKSRIKKINNKKYFPPINEKNLFAFEFVDGRVLKKKFFFMFKKLRRP